MKLGRYFIGLLSGLTFGMLFAPKKGKNFREELVKEGGKSGQDALVTLFTAFKDAGMDAVSEMKKLSDSGQLQSALSISKEKMHEYLSGLEEGGYDMAARAQEKMEEWSGMASQVISDQVKKKVVTKKKVATKVVKAKAKKVLPKEVSLTRKGVLKKKKSTNKAR